MPCLGVISQIHSESIVVLFKRNVTNTPAGRSEHFPEGSKINMLTLQCRIRYNVPDHISSHAGGFGTLYRLYTSLFKFA